MDAPLTSSLAEFAARNAAPSEVALQGAKLSALDWLAVGCAGAGEPVSNIVRDMVAEEGGRPEAHVFGSKKPVPVRGAALVNGTVSHALDYDDTHFAHIGHPSVSVFPAALAMAERRGASIQAWLHAALIGMETSIRVGLWLGRQHYQTGFHQTATAGAFGAATAAGRLLGFSTDEMIDCFGLSSTRAAGLKVQFGTMGKPYNAGLAAATGVEAAVLVARGFEPEGDALEGPFGFGATHAGEGDVAAALNGLGERWLSEDVSHKFHACCHGLHAALEAARTLDCAAPEIAGITVRTHPRWMTVCNQRAPETGLGAKFSYRTVLAMQSVGYDTADLSSYSARIATAEDVVDLRDRVEVIADEALTETGAHVEILRRDGVRRAAEFDLQTPLSLDERESRVRTKANALLGPDRSAEIWACLNGSGACSAVAAFLA